MVMKDITRILREAGVDAPGTLVRETPDTYLLQLITYNNWFTWALGIFKRRKDARIFTTIGTGGGSDAIGAFYAMKDLDTLVITDIVQRTLAVSEENVRRNVPGVDLRVRLGSICEPLEEATDIMYVNLPNMPGLANDASFHSASFRTGNNLAKQYLLETFLATLLQAPPYLNSGGVLVQAIGGRMPFEVIERMIIDTGYEPVEIVSGLKSQTQPELVIPGYAGLEKNGTDFVFYRMDKAKELIHPGPSYLEPKELREVLQPAKVNAREAYGLFGQGCEIGHEIHMVASMFTR